MANRRNFRRHQHAEAESLHAAGGFDLRSDVPAGTSINEIKEAIADSDDVRLEKLARAQQLVADPNYPPEEVVKSVAELLAKHLRPGGED
jgi:hypothetical protein